MPLQALDEYTRGEKTLPKAFTDAGLDAPAQSMYPVLAYAGRQMSSAKSQMEQAQNTEIQDKETPTTLFEMHSGYEPINKESKNNIKLRGEIAISTEEDLANNINRALSTLEQKTIHLGAIPENTKRKMRMIRERSYSKRGNILSALTMIK